MESGPSALQALRLASPPSTYPSGGKSYMETPSRSSENSQMEAVNRLYYTALDYLSTASSAPGLRLQWVSLNLS